ncbi:MAG: dipeptidase PepV [Acutalibacteraceae bacterium]
MMTDRINSYFDREDIRKAMLSDLETLIEIPSVLGEKEDGAPFGREPKRALLKMLEIAKRDNFLSENIDNYAGEINFSDKETALAVLGHLDVVPEGDGWTFEPYKMTVKDGKIYGRGTSDDKGPVIAAYYALKAIRDMGIELKKNVRLIVGTDEETGSLDMEHYTSVRKMPPMTFTPDSSFPVTNCEKGRFSKSFTCDFPEEEKGILSFDGGCASNAVPGKAKAVTKGFSLITTLSAVSSVKKKTGVNFETKTLSGDRIEISAFGTGAHASTPELGNNAVTALISVLSKLDRECKTVKIFKKLKKLFPHGVFDGSALGVKMSDDVSGALTLTLDVLKTENGVLTGVFDSRVPLCSNEENTAYKIRDILKKNGFTISDTEMVPGHYVDENSDFIKTLLKSYETFTGEKGYCEAIGGGTYVHEIEGGVAFGAIMPDTDTNMHGADEFMPVDELINAAKIFTLAIIELCS